MQPAKWGGWREGLCQSACVANSVGFRENTRQCLILQVRFKIIVTQIISQVQGYEDSSAECVGINRHVTLCDDVAICGVRSCGSSRQSRHQVSTNHYIILTNQRSLYVCYTLFWPIGDHHISLLWPIKYLKNIIWPIKQIVLQYATDQCEKLSKYHPAIRDINVLGSPAKHNFSKPDQACSIYCKGESGKGWVKLANTFYPDGKTTHSYLSVLSVTMTGTWCYADPTGMDYFCRDHKCQPGNHPLF